MIDSIEEVIMGSVVRDGNTGQLYEVEGGWFDNKGKLHIAIIPKEEFEED